MYEIENVFFKEFSQKQTNDKILLVELLFFFFFALLSSLVFLVF